MITMPAVLALRSGCSQKSSEQLLKFFAFSWVHATFLSLIPKDKFEPEFSFHKISKLNSVR
jgi:hypothetical protein